MKKGFVLLALAFCLPLWSQFREGERTVFTQLKPLSQTVRMVGDTSQILYVPFPMENQGKWASLFGLNLPAYVGSHYTDSRLGTGDVFIDITSVDGGGITDSLLVYKLPLSLNKDLERWHLVSNDTTFLNFDKPDVEVNPYYWDWTDGKTSGIPLSGEIRPAAGFGLVFEQKDEADNADNTLYITIWFVW